MKILTVCGLGQGTSLLLRMNVEEVITEMNINADVEHTDVSSAQSMNADVVITSAELAEILKTNNHQAEIIIINNFFDKYEIERSLQKYKE